MNDLTEKFKDGFKEGQDIEFDKIDYGNLIHTYKTQIKGYEEALKNGNVPKGQRQWANKILNDLRGALPCAEKQYRNLIDPQPENVGRNK